MTRTHEHPQQVELLRRQLQLDALEPGSATVGVDADQIGGRGALGRLAPQQGAHSREQLGQPKGLGHVVVSTGVETDDGVDLVGASREDQHGDRQPLGPNAPTDLEAVDERQPQVEQHEVWAELGAFERRHPVLAHVDVVALTAQCPGQWHRDGGIVLGEEHADHVIRSDRSQTGSTPT